jgi:SulP family sulfate permease
VALAQAAGISSTVPNPDGGRASASGDFTAQGAANVVGGCFGALPTGGSLSRTGVAVSAGARTRWTGILAGVWLIAIVVAFGSTAEIIPMAVIGGLILVIGAELIVGRLPDIRLVLRTSALSALAMVVTFFATTQWPLQDAILLGAVLSMILYCVQAARVGRLVSLTRVDGHWHVGEVPRRCPSREVTVLHYSGVGLFAEVPRIDETWPDSGDTVGAVLIVSLRTLPDVPSSAVVKAFERRAGDLLARGNAVMLAGVTPSVSRLLDRVGITAMIGAERVFPATDVFFEALDRAFDAGAAWLRERDSDHGSARDET